MFGKVKNTEDNKKCIIQSSRTIPLVSNVDVLVVGGATGAVAAAAEAAKCGLSVLLITNRTFLGDDVCSSYRFYLEQDELPDTELAKRLYRRQGDSQKNEYVPTPMHYKRTLENYLIESGAGILFSCFVSQLIYNKDKQICAAMIANRSGVQLILAKTVIDSTARATVARMTDTEFESYPTGLHKFKRVVVSNQPCQGKGISFRKVPAPTWEPNVESFVLNNPRQCKINPPVTWDRKCLEYTLDINMPDGSLKSFASAEHVARSMTFSEDQLDSSEYIYQIPPDPIISDNKCVDLSEIEEFNEQFFCPKNHRNLFILGGCAALNRDVATDMLRPTNYIKAGIVVGRSVAVLACELSFASENEFLPADGSCKSSDETQIKMLSDDNICRRYDAGNITIPDLEVPLLGEYDIVVAGGGTGGAPAGISAAKRGMKTLVVEYQHGLGGIAGVGLIGNYYCGNLGGFTAEIDKGVESMGDMPLIPNYHHDKKGVWNIEYKMEWLRRNIVEQGGDVWFGSIGYGVVMEDNKVVGVLVATPLGCGVVKCNRVIDSTGSSDIAIAAGNEYEFVGDEHIAMQGSGHSFKNLYTTGRDRQHWLANTDYTFVDDSDMLDVLRIHLAAREKFKDEYDILSIIQTRERRRIIGDYILSPLDIINNRTFEDSVVLAVSKFDTHGFTVHPVFMLKPPNKDVIEAYIPYRCMLPKDLDNILVTGLGISAHRDAMPVIRMEPDIQNQGYAAGWAAAVSIEDNVPVRQIDIKKLQRHLVQNGSLPESVLTDRDSYPYSRDRIAGAVANLKDDYQDISIVLAQFDDAVEDIRREYGIAQEFEAKVIYAHILAMMGDSTGLQTLLKAVDNEKWDKGWDFQGLGQYGACVSRLDSKIIAIGMTGRADAVGCIMKKSECLTPDSELSHFRAICMALEKIKGSTAVDELVRLLQMEGIKGYAVTADKFSQGIYDSPRNEAIREIMLARALYLCGDYGSLGKDLLKDYSRDIRAVFARHAKSVLQRNR